MNVEEAIKEIKDLQYKMEDIGFGDKATVLNTRQILAIDVILKELEKKNKRISKLEETCNNLNNNFNALMSSRNVYSKSRRKRTSKSY